jgi:hypothetical protein
MGYLKHVVLAAVSQLGNASRPCLDVARRSDLQIASDEATMFVALFNVLDAMAPPSVQGGLLWTVFRWESSKKEMLLLGHISRRLTLDPRIVTHVSHHRNFRQQVSEAYQRFRGVDDATMLLSEDIVSLSNGSLSDGPYHHRRGQGNPPSVLLLSI